MLNDESRCPRCTGVARVLGVSASLLVYRRCRSCGHVATSEHADREAISDVANALQVAVLLTFELEASAFEHLNQIGDLQVALRRATTALLRLQGR
jgi:hypothetical protein